MKRWLRKHMPDHAAVRENRWLHPFRNTLLHPRLWHVNRRSAAGGVATGLFCGLFPAPFQMFGAAICAVVFRVNLPIALLATLYTNPLTFVPLYLLAFWIGSLILGGESLFVPPPEFHFSALGQSLAASFAWLGQLGLPLIVGLLLLASSFSAIGYLIVRVVWRIRLVRSWHRRRLRRRQNAVAQQ
ncbi:MAG: DUF2062 domain-containing protein [Sulfuritalea sp.]|nr:DUF2062 domain-containing protein [Sulfuritalea sp.]